MNLNNYTKRKALGQVKYEQLENGAHVAREKNFEFGTNAPLADMVTEVSHQGFDNDLTMLRNQIELLVGQYDEVKAARTDFYEAFPPEAEKELPKEKIKEILKPKK